ncbi:IS66 family transposase, partial [Acidocella facilis]|uniref:IS66 family transposase n=1 Tax=Acidocella facilis TaxID=525 RepID=UPI001F35A2DB
MDAAAEIVSLRAQLAEREAELATAHLLIEQYKAQLHKLRRMQFGQSSEALETQIEQLELQLEDLEEAEAARVAATPQPRPARSPAVRKPLPVHLPREDVVYPTAEVCPNCGGTHLVKLGEDITEVLEKIPARLKVIRHVRPK